MRLRASAAKPGNPPGQNARFSCHRIVSKNDIGSGKGGRLLLPGVKSSTAAGDTAPIDSIAKLQDFLGTRSAYIAQKTLYGYVKARMGINYPRMFDSKSFIHSLNIAKQYVFAACLSDLTVHAVGLALHEQPADNAAREDLARRCYVTALSRNTGDAPEQFAAPDCVDEFERRLTSIDWQQALGPDVFSRSPKALVRWAPIADVLKISIARSRKTRSASPGPEI